MLKKLWNEKKDLSALFTLYDTMKKADEKPNESHFSILITLSNKANQPSKSLSLWKDIEEMDVELPQNVFWSLINASVKEKNQAIASQLLAKGKPLDPIAYTQLLKIVHPHQIIAAMEKDKVIPDKPLVLLLIRSCINLGNLQLAQQLDAMLRGKIKFDIVTYTAMMNLFSELGSSADVVRTFHEMRSSGMQLDVPAYNSAIKAFGALKRFDESKALFDEMKSIGLKPNDVTWIIHLSILGELNDVSSMESAFNEAKNTGKLTGPMFNAVLSGYRQSGHIDRMHRLLDEMKKMNVNPSEITFSILLSTYRKMGSLSQMEDVFNQMKHAGISPTTTSYNIMLDQCDKAKDGQRMKSLFQEMTRLRIGDEVTYNLMIHRHAADGEMSRVDDLMKEMKLKHLGPVQQTYNMFLQGVVESCVDLDKVRSAFDKIPKDLVTYHIFLGWLGKNRSVEEVKEFLVQMTDDKMEHSTRTWNIVLSCVGEKSTWNVVLDVFKEMIDEGHDPDQFTWATLLAAAGSSGDVNNVHDVVNRMKSFGVETLTSLSNGLMNAFGRCGCWEEAEQIFDQVPIAERDSFTWSTMISIFGKYREVDKAVAVFDEMIRTNQPIESIHLLSLMHAYSHALQPDRVLEIWRTMSERFRIEPNEKHVAVVIDALGRTNQIEEARKYVQEDCLIHWITLLGACRLNSNVTMGEIARQNIHRLDPSNASAYIMMANIQGELGEFEDQKLTLQTMKDQRIERRFGVSWIMIDGVKNQFDPHDTNHPAVPEIRDKAKEVLQFSKQHGYKPNFKWVSKNIPEDKKEQDLCEHSERYALYLGLLKTPPKSRLTVFKNLRVCGDCHEHTAVISKLYDREIRLRDTAVWHIFKDGKCNCGGNF
eukprot:TRINITY_DN2565_c0_g1_i1.p1 TRINITY_DN2565_c0_g1~~TRINITY_DN2565_c0_g1_i1.p1  ORF type:complete len:874 (+),score=248.66 TRINITY_DN2565_c0_g1_i1:126-2747(+)